MNAGSQGLHPEETFQQDGETQLFVCLVLVVGWKTEKEL